MNIETRTVAAKEGGSLSIDDLADDPGRIIRLTNNQMHSIPLADQHRLQLRAAQKRFGEMVERVAILKRLADEQGVTEIGTLEDLGLLLVPHSASKSYPLSFIESNGFDRLTGWLQGFTAHDLGAVDMAGCETIDDWIDRLDAQTPLLLVHSTGTSGKLSFLPRDIKASLQYAPGYVRQLDAFGDEPSLLGASVYETPFLYLQHRRGAYGQQRMLTIIQQEIFGGDASMIIAANPDRLSADAISLGGRLRAAESKGALGGFGAKLIERRDEFIAQQHDAEAALHGLADRALRQGEGGVAHGRIEQALAGEGAERQVGLGDVAAGADRLESLAGVDLRPGGLGLLQRGEADLLDGAPLGRAEALCLDLLVTGACVGIADLARIGEAGGRQDQHIGGAVFRRAEGGLALVKILAQHLVALQADRVDGLGIQLMCFGRDLAGFLAR